LLIRESVPHHLDSASLMCVCTHNSGRQVNRHEAMTVFRHSLALRLRQMVAMHHWLGHPEYTLGDAIQSVAKTS
jgi:hypothetical protein